MDNVIPPLEPWDKVSNSSPLKSKKLTVTLSLGDWQSLLDILEVYNDTDLPNQQECTELRDTLNILYLQRKVQYIHHKQY